MTQTESGWPRIVAHADMDAFYAAVEQLDDPALRGRPILVGSDRGRGVVLTASYEARPFGVGSAMPMAQAKRKCPQALIVPPRFERYQEISKAVMDVFAGFSPHVEAISLDEAFLDMTGAQGIFGGPRDMGTKLKLAVREATGGLTVTVGLSSTKYVAKVASGHDKPDGLTVVPPDEAREWLAPMPVSRLWGVGPKTEARLHALGLNLIADVAAADPAWLEERLGRAGAHFRSLSRAQDPRAVAGRRGSKSVGSENTLASDISDRTELKRHLRKSAEDVGRRLRRKGLTAHGVRVKLKTWDFRILTRQHRFASATDVAGTIYEAGAHLLDAFEDPGPFRLVGIAAYDLERAGEAPQGDLFAAAPRAAPGNPRQRDLETAIDALTARFGAGVLRRADDLAKPGRTNISPNLDFLDDADAED